MKEKVVVKNYGKKKKADKRLKYVPACFPKPPFCMGIIGTMGSGKTNIMTNVTKETEKYYDNVFVISPTYDSGENEDYYSIIKNIRVVVMDIDNESIEELIEEIKIVKSERNLLIIDDVSDFNVYQKNSPISRLIKLHRHSNLSMLICGHYLKDIPMSLRTVIRNWCIFRMQNNKEISYFYEEFGGNYRKSEFKDILDYCTKKEHSFMYINNSKRFIMRCFDKVVEVSE